MGVPRGEASCAGNGLPRLDSRALDELILELVGTAVAGAIARAEQRGEQRARALTTHLTVAEAAESLRISQTHCRKLIEHGTVPSLRLGHRVVVPRVALERLGCPSPHPGAATVWPVSPARAAGDTGHRARTTPPAGDPVEPEVT